MTNFYLSLRSFLFFLTVSAYLAISAQPAGYYNNATGLTGENLREALRVIITNGHTSNDYDNLEDDFYYTDNLGSSKVWDMYAMDQTGNAAYYYYYNTGDECGSYNAEGDCYNKEHSFPKSWWGGSTGVIQYADLFHLVPTDGYVNNRRSNYAFGEVASPTWTSTNGSKVGPNTFPGGYTDVVFEPVDAYKGDFARNYFYMATRYKNSFSSWTSTCPIISGDNYTEWTIDLLMDWNDLDPVSQKEIDRNNAVYTIQNNRNPYIDHPEYVNLVWGDGLEPEPSNYVTDFSAHCIVLNWVDATGTTLPEGYLIRMSATGFADIVSPSDGTAVSNDFNNKNQLYGVQTVTFGNLTPETTYYFKIFPYTGSGTSIDYKLDGDIPQISLTAN
ncbi:MAG: endonuclease [Bacteroidales bacterium]|nr:endonuclease [Bacteroidales bacterium]